MYSRWKRFLPSRALFVGSLAGVYFEKVFHLFFLCCSHSFVHIRKMEFRIFGWNLLNSTRIKQTKQKKPTTTTTKIVSKWSQREKNGRQKLSLNVDMNDCDKNKNAHIAAIHKSVVGWVEERGRANGKHLDEMCCVVLWKEWGIENDFSFIFVIID